MFLATASPFAKVQVDSYTRAAQPWGGFVCSIFYHDLLHKKRGKGQAPGLFCLRGSPTFWESDKLGVESTSVEKEAPKSNSLFVLRPCADVDKRRRQSPIYGIEGALKSFVCLHPGA